MSKCKDTVKALRWALVLVTLVWTGGTEGLCQSVLRIEWLSPDSLKIPLPATAVSDQAVHDSIGRGLDALVAAGYLEASADSLAKDSSTVKVYVHRGPRYAWAVLSYKHLSPELLRHLGALGPVAGETLTPAAFFLLRERILRYYEENGRPFASVYLDDIRIESGGVSASLYVDPERQVRIREVVNAGTATIGSGYLQRYLGLQPGSAFRRSRISEDAPRRLAELPFVQQRREPLIQFTGEEAVINVFLDKRSASRFDFVLGVLPNSRETGRLLITGTALMDLYNQFSAGERIQFAFQRLRPETQELKLAFSYPYLLDLPFGVDTRFQLYTRDTTNRDISWDAGLVYLLEGGDYVKAFWTKFYSDLLRVDTVAVINTHRLPAVLDVRNSLFGLEWQRLTLDYRYNPRKGWSIWARAGAGARRMLRNDQIIRLQDPSDPDFAFASLYDSLLSSTYQVRLEARLQRYFPVARYSAVLLGWSGGYFHTPAATLRNESYRIGGHRLLRGFDEESLFVSHYHVLTAEYRLLFGRNAHLFVFADGAWVTEQLSAGPASDWPYGFGGGLNLETSVGIFGLTAAVGGRRDIAPDFRSVKIHFGFVSLF